MNTRFPINGHARRPLLQFYFDCGEERSILRLYPYENVAVKVRFTVERTRILRILVDARTHDDEVPNELREGYRSYDAIAAAYKTRSRHKIVRTANMKRAKKRINRHVATQVRDEIARQVREVSIEVVVPELFQSERGSGVRIAPYIEVAHGLDPDTE